MWRYDYQDPLYPGVSDRVRNVLRRNGIRSLSEAAAMSDGDLTVSGRIGPRTLAEIRTATQRRRADMLDSDWPVF
jgi:DNA-directed RNA polymerase alpha subunit